MTVAPVNGGGWRFIPGIPTYQVNEIGAVRRAATGRILTPQFHSSGYWHVQMTVSGRPMNRLLHRLVAMAFIGEPPSDAHQAAHNDGDTNNNYWKNLRWATPKENCADRETHGTVARGERNGKLKHPDAIVRACRSLSLLGHSCPAISDFLGVPPAAVSGYVAGTRRQNVK